MGGRRESFRGGPAAPRHRPRGAVPAGRGDACVLPRCGSLTVTSDPAVSPAAPHRLPPAGLVPFC